ncbi:HEAT repeat domain-containing protein, partial [archaeon]|nr:HEAT repeat domain-containing protein [archaeon]
SLLAKGNPILVEDYASDFITALDDENSVVKANVSYVLGFIGAKDPDKVKIVIPKLIELLGSEPMLKENAAYALALIGTKDPEAIDDAVPELLKMVTDQRDEIRAASACALGVSCNPQAAKPLKKLLEDSAIINLLNPEAGTLTASTVSDVAKKYIKKRKDKY